MRGLFVELLITFEYRQQQEESVSPSQSLKCVIMMIRYEYNKFNFILFS